MSEILEAILLGDSIIVNFFTQSASQVIFQIYALGGWVIIAFLLLFAALYFFNDYKEDKYKANWKYVLFAVDIPQLNVQTPKAVEQMFSHLAGAFERPTIREKYRQGYKQRWFSLEIISIEGYIQFLVWTEETFRDLAEASIYAQYPEAEIIEIEDYVGALPDMYPNDVYDVWAADFGLAEKDAYPIRGYHEFEHSISKDTVLKDPMGTFLESFTRIGKGEQMWFQILVEPIDNSWKEKAIKVIKEIIGDKSLETKDTIGDKIIKSPFKILEYTGDQFFKNITDSVYEEPDRTEPNLIRYLTPGQSKLVEAMEEKISKIGFKTKIRGIYLARKEVFNPVRGVNALVGAVNQFNIPTANSIVPVVTTKRPTKRQSAWKKKQLVKAYKKRKMNIGGNPFVLNIEELATIWHFPMSHVKTPLVQKAAAKATEPPVGLPLEAGFEGPDLPMEAQSSELEADGKQFVTDSGEIIEYDDVY